MSTLGTPGADTRCGRCVRESRPVREPEARTAARRIVADIRAAYAAEEREEAREVFERGSWKSVTRDGAWRAYSRRYGLAVKAHSLEDLLVKLREGAHFN
jgi:muconolactone delta-isomerase